MPPPIANALNTGLSGRDHFAGIFAADVEREAEWLRRTAPPKADSIERLLADARFAPETVIEVGAGTGAVIGELRRRGVGREHYAVDFSDDALAVLRRDQPGVHVAVADVTQTPDPFGAGPYDLAIASHVVEHLEDPGAFLQALRQVPLERLVVEVPLENLFFGRLKARINDRAKHPAGHVQFFTRETFVDLLERSGWQVLNVRVYASALDAETFAFAFGQASRRTRALKRVTEYVLPRLLGPLWTRLYHAHCTALCVARPG